MVVYEFEKRTVNFEGFPPAPVAWFINTVDTLCYPLQCSDWRETLSVPEGSWLSYRVPSISENVPKFMDYSEFVQQQPDGAAAPYSFASLYQFAFETPSTALSLLTTPEAAFVLCLLVLLIRVIKSFLLPFFRSVGRKAARKSQGEKWEAENQERIVKFGEYVFRLVFHSSISIYGLYYFLDKEWWARDGFNLVGGRAYSQGYPNHPLEPGFTWYYLVQAAYNLDAMFSLLEISFYIRLRSSFAEKSGDSRRSLQFPIQVGWSKSVRGDFSEMCIHHVLTNILVFGSSHARLTRLGSTAFLLHDISDVPVDLSKLANFLKWKVTTLVCFFMMTVTWMITRLILLPSIFFYFSASENQYTLEDGLPLMIYICYRHMFYYGLALLVFLHVTWFLMFIRMFLTLVTKNELHDYSEHKNGEDQHNVSKKNK
jgi:hypothetical protein